MIISVSSFGSLVVTYGFDLPLTEGVSRAAALNRLTRSPLTAGSANDANVQGLPQVQYANQQSGQNIECERY